MKNIFFTKEIKKYFLVSLTFIPVSIGINMLNLGFIFNIIAEVVICVGIYGGYLLYTKDPLVKVILNKIHKKGF